MAKSNCAGCGRYRDIVKDGHCRSCSGERAAKQARRRWIAERQRNDLGSIAARNAVAVGFRRYHKLSAKKPGAPRA